MSKQKGSKDLSPPAVETKFLIPKIGMGNEESKQFRYEGGKIKPEGRKVEQRAPDEVLHEFLGAPPKGETNPAPGCPAKAVAKGGDYSGGDQEQNRTIGEQEDPDQDRKIWVLGADFPPKSSCQNYGGHHN